MKTVNVIEISGDGDDVLGLQAFPDTPEGNKEAEEAFASCLRENGPVAEDVVEAAIEEGYWEIGDYTVLLVHSR